MHTGRRGSYIVEATVCLPLLIIAMVVMTSIILYYACIEDTAYVMSTEMRRTAVEAIYGDTSALLPVRTARRVLRAHSNVKKFYMTEYGYRRELDGIDEVIYLKYRMELETKNPAGIAAEAVFYPAYATRAYVGRERDVKAMSRDEFMREGDGTVYIFPKDGERFHKKNCTFVKVAPEAAVLNGDVKGRYSSCPTCGSGNAEEGSIVYVFPQYGAAFHLRSCSSIDRQFVEVEESVAMERGYTACTKCGG